MTRARTPAARRIGRKAIIRKPKETMMNKASGAIMILLLLFFSQQAFAQTWDWSYAYGRPGSQHAMQYIKAQNAEVVFEEPVYYWKPRIGAKQKGEKPGSIVYRFVWDKPVAKAHLYVSMPTFHWAYSKGHNKLFASKDAVHWIQLMDVPPPAFGKANSGLYDRDLPENLLGGTELWLKVELDAFGPKADLHPVYANTAQLNRFDKNSKTDCFKLSVNFMASDRPTIVAPKAEEQTTLPKGRVLD
jgi:hypothetical protein